MQPLQEGDAAQHKQQREPQQRQRWKQKRQQQEQERRRLLMWDRQQREQVLQRLRVALGIVAATRVAFHVVSGSVAVQCSLPLCDSNSSSLLHRIS